MVEWLKTPIHITIKLWPFQKNGNGAGDWRALCEKCFYRIKPSLKDIFILNIRKNLLSQKAILYAHSFYCEGNDVAEVEENNFDVTPTFDDDAHKVIVSEGYGYSWSQIELCRKYYSKKAKKQFRFEHCKKLFHEDWYDSC